jgi:hypothetical protein
LTFDDTIQWLLRRGGPAIRYRTASELAGFGNKELRPLAASLLASNQVQAWLARLERGGLGDSEIHNGRPEAFENAAGKLIDLGLKAGMKALDSRMDRFRQGLRRRAEVAASAASAASGPFPGSPGYPFYLVLLAAGILRAGYDADETAAAVVRERLRALAETAKRADYDIYMQPEETASLPAAYRGKPVLRDDLGGHTRLPVIHDFYALAALPRQALGDEGAAAMVGSLTNYVLDDRYHAFPEGYGYFRTPGRRFYAAGWSVHLPGHGAGFGLDDWRAGMLVQRLELMAAFPAARRHPWFGEALSCLETFRTDAGTYLFPRRLLRESPSGYWVTGAYMGLEEDRRRGEALELESTFRMMRIKRTAGPGRSQPGASAARHKSLSPRGAAP